jgi:hypothetical protein
MLVSSLEYMEQIVQKNKDLDWNGWDVVRYKKSSSAMFRPDGVFRNGVWHKKTTFPLTEVGWKVPKNIGTDNV